ncbi:MAG: anti-sigma factor [Sporichthyaceae bacterium]
MSERNEPLEHHLGHRLAGWVDGELPPGTRQLVAAHLATCSTCRVAAVKESRTKADLRDLGGPAPSQDLMASLLNLQGQSPLQPTSQPNTAGAGSVFPSYPSRRRSGVAAPLLAAGVASVAALTVASAWLTGDVAPAPGESRVQQASIGGAFEGLPDGRPTTSFTSFSGTSGVGEPKFVEVLRLR